MKTQGTTLQLMKSNFAIGHKFFYQKREAVIIGYEEDDATPLAIIKVSASWLSESFKTTIPYNRLVELSGIGYDCVLKRIANDVDNKWGFDYGSFFEYGNLNITYENKVIITIYHKTSLVSKIDAESTKVEAEVNRLIELYSKTKN